MPAAGETTSVDVCRPDGTSPRSPLCERHECLLGDERRTGANCRICDTLREWQSMRSSIAFVREIRQGSGLYLYPGGAAEDGQGCLMQFPLTAGNLADVRSAVNLMVLASDYVWISDPAPCAPRSTRIR